jgi:hypothetical protein
MTQPLKVACIVLLAILAGCSNDKTPFFQGTIEYAYTYQSDSLNADSISMLRPKRAIFRYDTSNYQSTFIGKDTTTYYYSGTLNKALSGSPLECENYGTATDSVLSVRVYDTDEKILGNGCRILEMTKSRSFVRYYVSTETRIAPTTYKLHRSYNWDVYGEKSDGGIILKVEHRFGVFTMHGLATSITPANPGFKALDIDESLIRQICEKGQ